MSAFAADTNTSVFCVIGNPIVHSLSPAMHGRALGSLGVNAVYTAFCVTDIAAAVMGFRALGIKGISVTIPHKMTIMEHLDEIDDHAKAVGAVNTVVNRDGRLIGMNSDSRGAADALSEHVDPAGRTVVVIGAGGAARAVAFGLKEKGADIVIANRSPEKGIRLAKDIGGRFIPLPEIGRKDGSILVNATSLGMHPETDRTPVSSDVFKKGMTVMDIVYNPLRTRFLAEAEAAGCKTVDGVSMFVYQGAFQFESFTGKPAPVQLMRETVLAELKKRS